MDYFVRGKGKTYRLDIVGKHCPIAFIHLRIVLHPRNKNGNLDDLAQVATTGFEDLFKIAKSLNLSPNLLGKQAFPNDILRFTYSSVCNIVTNKYSLLWINTQTARAIDHPIANDPLRHEGAWSRSILAQNSHFCGRHRAVDPGTAERSGSNRR